MTTSAHQALEIPPARARIPVLAVITAAMESEAAPMWDIVKAGGNIVHLGAKGALQLLQVEDAVIALVTTGVGLVNAASALTAALTYVSPRYIFSCGSAGGLDAKAQVGEVTAGTEYLYSGADARLFDYQLGQIPGMPETFKADPDLLDRFRSLPAQLGPTRTRAGLFLSADRFVGAEDAWSCARPSPKPSPPTWSPPLWLTSRRGSRFPSWRFVVSPICAVPRLPRRTTSAPVTFRGCRSWWL